MKLIDKDTLVAEIKKRIKNIYAGREYVGIPYDEECIVRGLQKAEDIINAIEVKDPYEQIVQYDSIKAGIQAHAETYSFNIESKLFSQLTKEQQKLWREEIEQACVSGGEAGIELARDPRYKENLEVKEVDLEKEIDKWWCSQFTDYSMVRVPNHKFVPKPEYIDSNFKQSETGKTKIGLELCVDWKIDSNDIEWDPDTIRNFAKYFYELSKNGNKSWNE